MTSRTCGQSIIGLIIGKTTRLSGNFSGSPLSDLKRPQQQCVIIAPFHCIFINLLPQDKRLSDFFVRKSIPKCFACSGQHLFLDRARRPIIKFNKSIIFHHEKQRHKNVLASEKNYFKKITR